MYKLIISSLPYFSLLETQLIQKPREIILPFVECILNDPSDFLMYTLFPRNTHSSKPKTSRGKSVEW